MNTFENIRRQIPKLINSIIAIGNPMVDITAQCEMNHIEEFHLNEGINYSTNNNVGFFSRIEEMIYVSKSPGGSALNILRSLSWCLKNNNIKGKKLSILGSVGDDIYKNMIIRSLQSLDINTELLEQLPNKSTSKCAVAIYENKGYFLTDILASKLLSINFVQNNWNEILSHDAIIIEGYFIKENYQLCRQICEQFSNNGKYIILTLSDPSTIEQCRNEINEIAKMADMIVGSQKSALKFIGEQNNIRINDLFQKINQILNKRDRIILITVGKQGVFCSKYDSNTNRETNFQSFPLTVPSIVDLNGAGDAFLGGFLSQQMQNQTLEKCCNSGNNTASIVIQNIGCNFPQINRN